jgi:hypothetical protein
MDQKKSLQEVVRAGVFSDKRKLPAIRLFDLESRLHSDCIYMISEQVPGTDTKLGFKAAEIEAICQTQHKKRNPLATLRRVV